MLEQVKLILKRFVFSPTLCHLQTFRNHKTNYTKIWTARKSSGFLYGWTQLQITRSDWEQSWSFPIAGHLYKMAARPLWQHASADYMQKHRAVIWKAPWGQWLFWGMGTLCETPYNLVLVLRLHTLRGLRRISWLISSLHNCFHWVLSGTRWKRLYAPGPHPTMELSLG